MTMHLESDLELLNRLGVNPATVFANSVEVGRAQDGRPLWVSYRVIVTEGLDNA